MLNYKIMLLCYYVDYVDYITFVFVPHLSRLFARAAKYFMCEKKINFIYYLLVIIYLIFYY